MNKIDTIDQGEGIAIIGMACRFPGAKDVDQFWQNLRDGKESISFFTDQELLEEGIAASLLDDPNYVKAGAFLEGIKDFDAAFFGYFPREAETIDPQQRLFLETAWTALEAAGYSTDSYRGQIGVYGGSRVNEYLLHNLYPSGDRFGLKNRIQPLALGDDDYLATRVSHKLDLRGPSLKVQAACSTSLVAIHLACQALLDGECDMALAGGVALRLPAKSGYLYQEGNVASPDGHCRAFDTDAQGTIFGNGVGVIVLKRLADAIGERDHIEAVIKGSAINNDGGAKLGFTAPSAEGQARVIAEALEISGVDAETVTYVEAHGTATPIGDRIEVEALTRAFRGKTQKRNFCAIGSVKSNIGHASAAAGVAGVIKTVLALKHRLIPPTLNCQRCNPNIDFANSPFYVNTQLSEWQSDASPRRAGVSAFGIGGSNAHMIMEEAPARSAERSPERAQLLLLSAKTPSALDTATANLLDHLKSDPELVLADIAFTLQAGRKAFNHRRALVARSLSDCIQAIESADGRRLLTSDGQLNNGEVGFMFPGQGSQYVDMARELYQTEPLFRAEIELCAEILEPALGLNLRDILYPAADRAEAAASRLARTVLAQPALFTVEYAMSRLLISWGVEPQVMIGHSVGEYVAACLAGVFSVEDGLRLIAARGLLMDGLPGGAMLAVSLPPAEAKPLLGDNIALAAYNSPVVCVVSGPHEAIERLQQTLGEMKVECRRLHTSHAFHSHMMEPVLQAFTEEVRKVKLEAPSIPYLSNVSGTWITGAEATDAGYWARQLRGTVRFSEGLSALFDRFSGALLEVGPGQSLTALVKQHRRTDRTILATSRHPQEHTSDRAQLLETLGRLWLSGISPDWLAVNAGHNRRRIALPTYPFERRRYWVEPDTEPAHLRPRSPEVEKLPDIDDWFYLPSWKRSVAPEWLGRDDLKAQSKSWLVFLDSCGLGARLVSRLEALEQKIVVVEIGERFSRIEQDRYALDPRSGTDYFDLIQNLVTEGTDPRRIVHLWSLTRSLPPTGMDSFEALQRLGFHSLVYLAQALARNGLVMPLRIDFCANEIQDVTGDVCVRPEKITALGPCQVIPQEYANITCHSIDVVLPDEGAIPDLLVEQLTQELMARAVDPVVAYRGKHRWTQDYAPVRLCADDRKLRLRPGGVYLITGGLGRIGLALGRYLAAAVNAKLILIGRSALPDREAWKKLRDSTAPDPVRDRIHQIEVMEDLGAEALTLSADAGSMEQMQAAIAEGEKRFGSLNGVIHAAGILGDAVMMPLPEVRPEKCLPQFNAKVRGLLVLDELLRGRELDFCIATSSLSSVLGGLGLTAYAAGNLFMDGFAHHRLHTGGLVWESIDFDAWNFSDEAARGKRLGAAVRPAMSAEEGIETFRRILSATPQPQVIVSCSDLAARLRKWRQADAAGVANPVPIEATASENSSYSRPTLANPYAAPTNAAERTIASIWEELLGISGIGIHDSFLDLGGHSLIATRMLSRIRDAFKMDLSIRNIFEAKTVAELAKVVQAGLEPDGNQITEI